MSRRNKLPQVRGRLMFDEPLAPFTWLRVGGPAEVIFMPADESDLADFLKGLDPAVPVLPLGVGSNTLVRDGGLDGVVIRLGKPFAAIEALDGARIKAGAACFDAQVARAAAKAGVASLEFYAGIPGTIGGAVAMNAGCYGSETKDVLVEASGFDRAGRPVTFSAPKEFTYRHGWGGEQGVIVTSATFQGRPDAPQAVEARMAEITARREQTQPIREKTGGSTFKNPPGHSSWKLIDEAGWRGKRHGGAKFSELHSNFLINTGEATAADLEGLGETVRADVRSKTGIDLQWEIKRVGKP
ncbi:MAG: UDP-N-acetylmuramate dehydrogenase [Alphaproteobacteria bacterium]